MDDFSSIDAIYVLSVKTFTDRIAHIQKVFSAQKLSFEFIFEYDIPDLTPDILARYFDLSSQKLTPAHQSLILKHITAWQKAIDKQHKTILVFEDDVFLQQDFAEKLKKVMCGVAAISPGYLVFLGGESAAASRDVLLAKTPIVLHPIETAEGYLTDITANQKRFDWLAAHKIDLPADHLIKQIDQESGIAQYWSAEPLVRQGSLFGAFESTLDDKRKSRSAFLNKLFYVWKVLKRKKMMRLYFKVFKR